MDHDIDFGILLGLAYQQFVGELHEHLDAAGFTGLRSAFGYAFKVLARNDLTIGRLAEHLDMTHQGAAKLVDEMVNAGYAERRPDPADGRVKRVVLTDQARALMASGSQFHNAFEADLATEIGPEAAAALRKALITIVERADSPDGLTRTLRPLA
ncbi:winged helix-turn-helix transcriptional regulator [Actinomadura barringtoniae]|uniref:Winged helix-turn-helix transcriptional regulator n=1 Tax=Actinomadura barringtoniae TaxID=1427535 RepID=A0A939PFT3_9ACTN|nr:MarR family winged helix-turn-helix transcriptional regulator [Actinomadura barringtoniae]MBO2451730.1 winged helix-turn-helix transcriptional regulator [Actinomadura barringtoniae]